MKKIRHKENKVSDISTNVIFRRSKKMVTVFLLLGCHVISCFKVGILMSQVKSVISEIGSVHEFILRSEIDLEYAVILRADFIFDRSNKRVKCQVKITD